MANNLSAFSAEAWSKRLVTRLDQTNVGKFLCNTDYEGEIQGVGSTVWVRTPGDITMGTYTKGLAISYQDLAPTKESFQILEAKYFAFDVDDIDKAQTDLNTMDIYVRRAMVAINNTIDAKILGQYGAALAANQVGTGAPVTLDSGTTTTGVYSNFAKMAELLSNQNVPEDGRWAIVNPTVRTLLWNDTSHFVRATDLGDAIVTSGKFGSGEQANARNAPGFAGRILGFDVYVISHLPVVTGGKVALFGDRDAITYAAQINSLEAIRRQDTFADAVRGLLLHDAKVFTETSKRLATLTFAN